MWSSPSKPLNTSTVGENLRFSTIISLYVRNSGYGKLTGTRARAIEYAVIFSDLSDLATTNNHILGRIAG